MEKCKSAKVVELIEVITLQGSGDTETQPIKEVVQYWTKSGELLFENSLNEMRNSI